MNRFLLSTAALPTFLARRDRCGWRLLSVKDHAPGVVLVETTHRAGTLTAIKSTIAWLTSEYPI